MIETMTNRVRAVGLALALPAVLALGAAPGAAQETQEYPPQEDPQETMEQEGQQQEGQDLISVAEEAENLTLFVQAVRSTGLQEALQQEGPFTVFAPTDEAFQQHFSDEELNRLFGPEAVQKAKEGEQRDTYPQRDDETQPRPTDDPMDPQQDPMDPQQQGQEGQETGQAQEHGHAGQQATQEDREELLTVLRTHLVMGEWTVDQLRNRENVQNILGQELAIEDGAQAGAQARGETPVRDDQDMRGQERAERQDEQDTGFQEAGRELGPEESLRIAGEAEVVRADLRASNGVIHVIDTMLEQAELEDLEQDEAQPFDQEEQDETWPETDPTERDTIPSVR